MPAKANFASEKYTYWRQIMERFTASGLSGAQFCKQQDLKYTSFADWRQRLRRQAISEKGVDRRSTEEWMAVFERARSNPAGIQQYCDDNGISSKAYYKRFHQLKRMRPEWAERLHGRKGGRKKKQTGEANINEASPAIASSSFVPVKITEETTDHAGVNTIDVILPSAITLRLGPGCSAELLRTVVSTLGDLHVSAFNNY